MSINWNQYLDKNMTINWKAVERDYARQQVEKYLQARTERQAQMAQQAEMARLEKERRLAEAARLGRRGRQQEKMAQRHRNFYITNGTKGRTRCTGPVSGRKQDEKQTRST